MVRVERPKKRPMHAIFSSRRDHSRKEYATQSRKPVWQEPFGTLPVIPSNETLVLGDWPSSPLRMPIEQYRIDVQGKQTHLCTKPMEPLSCPPLAPRRPRLGWL